MGTGPTFWWKQCSRVECLECGFEVVVVLLMMHCHIHYGIGQGVRGGASPPPHPTPPVEAQTYRVSFPKHMFRLQCLLEGCLGGASNWTNLRVRFAHLHAQDTIVILEEGNKPYPR